MDRVDRCQTVTCNTTLAPTVPSKSLSSRRSLNWTHIGRTRGMKGRDMRLVQEYLGHTNVRNTARYMDGVSARFRGIRD
jgi:integrase